MGDDGSVWMGEVQYKLNGMLHGPVHIMLGGHWMMEPISEWVNEHNVSDQVKFASGWDEWLLMGKQMWREGWIRCPETCSSDTPQRDCMCTCPSEVMEGRSPKDILFNMSSVMAFDPSMAQYWHDMMGMSWEMIWDNLCSVGHPGDMFTSSAPQDPIFWPLHGNSERFVQLLRLESYRNNLVLTETWGYSHSRVGISSDLHMVCDWSEQEGYGKPYCYRDTCSGHKADDILPFTSVVRQPRRHPRVHQRGVLQHDLSRLGRPQVRL